MLYLANGSKKWKEKSKKFTLLINDDILKRYGVLGFWGEEAKQSKK